MKVTIKATDHDKAMVPTIWSHRVGVRYFRAPPRKRNEGSTWASQTSAPNKSNDTEVDKIAARPEPNTAKHHSVPDTPSILSNNPFGILDNVDEDGNPIIRP